MNISHAGAVAFRGEGGQVMFLIVSSSDGFHWVLPKGHIESEESAEHAALRELREEAGIIGEVIAPLDVQRFHKHGEDVGVQYFLVRAVQQVQALESRVVRWEDAPTALTLLSFQEAQVTLQQGAEKLSAALPGKA